MNERAATHADPRVEFARDRTGMAKFRTQLALDRTTLAWIRTTLTMAMFGFGMIGYFRSLAEKSPTARSMQLHQGAINFGTTLVVLATIATVFAGVSHWFSLRRLRRDEDVVLSQWPVSIAVAMLIAILGLGGLWFALSH